jgi:hypothetical protein
VLELRRVTIRSGRPTGDIAVLAGDGLLSLGMPCSLIGHRTFAVSCCTKSATQVCLSASGLRLRNSRPDCKMRDASSCLVAFTVIGADLPPLRDGADCPSESGYYHRTVWKVAVAV